MKRLLEISLPVLLVLILLTLGLPGCSSQSDVVEVIHIFKAQSPSYPPPPGGWALMPTGPHPAAIQEVFDPGDKMNLGLVISSQIKTDVTFSRFTFFNKGTGTEAEVESSPGDLGPFGPGSKVHLAFLDPWDIPSEAGEYEIRVYLGDEVVASALFNVGVWPASWGLEMEIFPAPIHEVKVIIEEPHPPPAPWVWVYIKGGLPDSCATCYGTNCQYIGNTVNIKITLQHPKGAECAQVYGYFEEYIPIGGNQYVSGDTYTVNVNDYMTTFVMP